MTELMHEPVLSQTRLVGGTALALQIGHRKSTDLDLFAFEKPDIEAIVALLSGKYGYRPLLIDDKTTIGTIGDVKVDVIHHPYLWLEGSVTEEAVRLASIKDIAAMKLHAIANSGERPKDFVDIAFLSQYFSYETIKVFALEKYPMYGSLMFDRAIIYFDDVNKEAISEIKMIDTVMEWGKIKKRIVKMTDAPDKVFKTSPLSSLEAQESRRS